MSFSATIKQRTMFTIQHFSSTVIQFLMDIMKLPSLVFPIFSIIKFFRKTIRTTIQLKNCMPAVSYPNSMHMKKTNENMKWLLENYPLGSKDMSSMENLILIKNVTISVKRKHTKKVFSEFTL
jgi:hypothetical protein